MGNPLLDMQVINDTSKEDLIKKYEGLTVNGAILAKDAPGVFGM
jgi:hypothetical protein